MSDEELRELERQLAGEDVRDAARAVLDPDEELRALAEIGVAFGDDGPVAQWQSIELESSPRFDRIWAFCTKTTFRKVVFAIVLAPLFVLSTLDSLGPPAVLDRMLGGRTCVGPRDSSARRMQHALSTFGGNATHGVVSDRRLVVARKAIGATRFSPVMSVPLTDVATARRRPRGPWRRRVELRFADDSRIVLAVPSLTHPPSRPAEVISAVGAGKGQP